MTTAPSANALTFQTTTFQPVAHIDNGIWLRHPHIAGALQYERDDRVLDLFNRNAEEFNDSMTALVKLPSAGGMQETRIFSLRGAHLLGMLARTKQAKAFRAWVLDVLEHQHQPAPAPAALPAQTLSCLIAQRDALLSLVREQQLEKYPHLRLALRYHRIEGLNYQEKALLMGWKSTTAWTECLHKMAAIGLISYTPDPRLQANGRAAYAKLKATRGEAPPVAPSTAPKPPRKGPIRPRTKVLSERQAAHLEVMRVAAAAKRATHRANMELARAALQAGAKP